MRGGLLVFLGFLPAVALASTVVAVPETALVSHADTIALGTIMTTTTYVSPEGQIRTRATVAVHRGVRGAHEGDVIVVEVPGGQLPNGLVATTVGAPVLHVGAMIFGFFETHGAAKRPLGLSYGLYAVRTDTHGALVVERDLSALHLVNVLVPMHGKTLAADPARLATESLDALLTRVQAQVAAAAQVTQGGTP